MAEAAPIPERLQKALDRVLYARGSPVAQAMRNFLNGTWLGEPLHVVLTDIPIGLWSGAAVFDALALAGDSTWLAHAADTAITLGLAGALAAAAAGVTDWSDVDPPARRTGLFHGLLNLGAIGIFTTSLVLRRKGARTSGRIASLLGLAIMGCAARLGGQMVYQQRVGVDRSAGAEYPSEFTAILAAEALPAGKLTRAYYNCTPIVLVRRGEQIFALAETCSHFGGPLAEGKLLEDSVVCPYHFSRFALKDGRVLNGPAVHPQPCFEVRTRKGQIEIRLPGHRAC